ncbi:MAG: N-acetyltransferase [Pseudomonadota bacterium]
MGELEVRPTVAGDEVALETLYPASFPDEELRPLVRALLALADVISLAALRDGQLIGHVVLTPCAVDGKRVDLLGPLAVLPAHQRKGAGSALVRAGVSRSGAVGATAVVLLGSPAYYGRLGFTKEDRVRTPYPLPDEWGPAWQGLSLTDPPEGRLHVPEPWRVPAYWGP